VDSLPGHQNRVELYADEPGRYRGQCAEFCGAQHAQMGVTVYADPPERFQGWLANMSRPRPEPATPLARRGEQVFLANQCSSCHTVRGTRARGEVGPDLTHLKSRETLAALAIPNRRGYLAGWVLDPQNIKEGAKMPSLNLTGPELQALLEYLESLK
jgi:cytochrome c oxidase subunit 2